MIRATSPAPANGETEETTAFVPDATELQSIGARPTPQALPRAAVFLGELVQDPKFLRSHVLPVLEEARDAERWYVARRWDDPDGSFSLQVFVWPPGTRTKIHDHSSWGAYACAAGTVFEERYTRLDDGSRHEHARLEGAWQLAWSPEDGASTVLPGDGGVHSVGNPYGEAAVSVHLYGPRLEDVDGRDYDPSRDYVCDRLDDAAEEMDGTVAFRGQPPLEWTQTTGNELFQRRRSDMAEQSGAQAEVDRGRTKETN